MGVSSPEGILMLPKGREDAASDAVNFSVVFYLDPNMKTGLERERGSGALAV